MNKKMILLLAFSATNLFSMQPLTKAQEEERIEYLWNLQKNNAFTASAVAGGYDLAQVLERDLEIVNQDLEAAKKARAFAQGLFFGSVVPGALRFISGMAGLSGLASGVAASIGGYSTYNWWKNLPIIDTAALKLIEQVPVEHWLERWNQKGQYLFQKSPYVKENQYFRQMGIASVAGAGASIIAGLTSLYFANKYNTNKAKNTQTIEQMDVRIARDQVLIAALEAIQSA